MTKSGLGSLYVCQLGGSVPAGMATIVYRSSPGPTGFDVDELGLRVLSSILSDAWEWDVVRHCSRNLALELASGDDTVKVLRGSHLAGRHHERITYHAPRPPFLSEFEAAMEPPAAMPDSRIDRLPFLPLDEIQVSIVGLSDRCEFIAIWRVLDLDAKLITRDLDRVVGKLRSICMEFGVVYVEVDRVDDLPVW